MLSGLRTVAEDAGETYKMSPPVPDSCNKGERFACCF